MEEEHHQDSEIQHHIDAEAMLPTGCPHQGPSKARTLRQAVSWETRTPLEQANELSDRVRSLRATLQSNPIPSRDFPGGPVVKTRLLHCKQCEFDSW